MAQASEVLFWSVSCRKKYSSLIPACYMIIKNNKLVLQLFPCCIHAGVLIKNVYNCKWQSKDNRKFCKSTSSCQLAIILISHFACKVVLNTNHNFISFVLLYCTTHSKNIRQFLGLQITGINLRIVKTTVTVYDKKNFFLAYICIVLKLYVSCTTAYTKEYHKKDKS